MDFARMPVGAVCRYLNEHNPPAEVLALLSADNRITVRRAAARCLARLEIERKERERLDAMLAYERSAWDKGFTYIAGVDEAGRGPLAGPVVAAAVILQKGCFFPGLNDSKQVTPDRREELYRAITTQAVAWSVGISEVAEIDRINILQASKLAMHRAIASLAVKPDFVLLDAVELDGLLFPRQSVVRGDCLSQSIAAASIIAKVTRDRWMCDIDKAFPGYGFAVHKGYATIEHRRAIARLGASPVHRKSFLLLPGKEP